MTCIDLTSKRSKMLSYVAKHSKQRKTTKPIKLQWIASIGCQNDQNKAKLQNRSKSNDLHRLDVKTMKTKLKLNYKSDQNPMTCIDLTLKRSKMLSYVAKHSKQHKTTKPIKLQWIASSGCQNDQNKAKLQMWSKFNDLHRLDVKTIKTKLKLNYKSDQNPMTCIDLTSKRSKMLSYVAKHSKQRKTTKPIKLQWIASIGCQNDQNKAKLNYKSDQNPMTCIDLTSKRSKMLSYVAKHSKQHKTTKPIKLQWIASIGCQNDQNKAKLQMWSKSNDLHRFDVKTIKNVELRRKTFKTTQNYKTYQFTMNCIDDVKTIKTKPNYKSNQITITCIDWMSKRWKQS